MSATGRFSAAQRLRAFRLDLLAAGVEIHCLRDLTRGGLASALNEIAEIARVCIAVEETLVPVREEVHAACELLGLEPLRVANEGRFVAFVPARDAPRAVEIIARHQTGTGAAVVGEVTLQPERVVLLKSRIGVDARPGHAERGATATDLLTAASALTTRCAPLAFLLSSMAF